MNKFIPISAVLCAGLYASVGHAEPSFNCTGTLNETEQAICDNTDLSTLDVVLDGLFSAVLATSGGSQNMIDQQNAWIATRNACGGDVACISAEYTQRNQALVAEISGQPTPNNEPSSDDVETLQTTLAEILIRLESLERTSETGVAEAVDEAPTVIRGLRVDVFRTGNDVDMRGNAPRGGPPNSEGGMLLASSFYSRSPLPFSLGAYNRDERARRYADRIDGIRWTGRIALTEAGTKEITVGIVSQATQSLCAVTMEVGGAVIVNNTYTLWRTESLTTQPITAEITGEAGLYDFSLFLSCRRQGNGLLYIEPQGHGGYNVQASVFYAESGREAPITNADFYLREDDHELAEN